MTRRPPESIKQPLVHDENRRHLAPCRGARRLLIIAVSATSLVVFAVATDLVLRTANENDTASQWMKQLALFAPALHTAGAPMRHPETMHPGIDLRYGAGLERFP